jgi:2,3-bisphosphoglycerate-dependent phosphoglycerate mutase
MSFIILVRHGESQANAQEIVSGADDWPLTQLGKQQARQAAEQLRHVKLDKAYTSQLSRAKDTLAEIAEALHRTDLPVVIAPELNERDFGALTGQPKAEVKQQIGNDQFNAVVWNWDVPAPDGESLKMTHDRVVPYFQKTILADATNGQNILVVAHRQLLRALVKHLDNIPDDQIAHYNLENAEVISYKVDDSTGALQRAATLL